MTQNCHIHYQYGDKIANVTLFPSETDKSSIPHFELQKPLFGDVQTHIFVCMQMI